MFKGADPSHSRDEELKVIRAGGLTWTVRTSFLSPELLCLLENPDRHLPNVDSMSFHERPSTSIKRGSTFFLKRFNRPSGLKMFKSVWRRSAAGQSFWSALRLERAAIRTARTIAVADRRFARVLVRSYLVTETIEHARNLDEWAVPERKRARETAVLVARLHQNGFMHRDLNLKNILVDAHGELFIVDLDRMRRRRILTKSEAIDDLARFARNSLRFSRLSRIEIALFLKTYCSLRGFGDWRPVWKEIVGLNEIEYARLMRKSNVSSNQG